MGLYTTIFAGILFSILLWIVVVDCRRYIIPDIANAALLFVGCVQTYVFQENTFFSLITCVIAAGGSFLLLRQGFFVVRGVHGLGLGDVKFMAASGAWLSLDALPLMLLVSCLSAFSFVFFKLVRRGQLGRYERIAFGPHLALGLALVWGGEQLW
jgi:leader peptidase (prepilin peptidase) / N-methyltransferase